MRCIWDVTEDVGAGCGPFEIAPHYAASPHCVVAASDLMVTDTVPKGGYYPILSAMLDTNLGEFFFYVVG
jgi:hypothetical protein